MQIVRTGFPRRFGPGFHIMEQYFPYCKNELFQMFNQPARGKCLRIPIKYKGEQDRSVLDTLAAMVVVLK